MADLLKSPGIPDAAIQSLLGTLKANVLSHTHVPHDAPTEDDFGPPCQEGHSRKPYTCELACRSLK